MRRREDLYTPSGGGRRLGVHYDPDAFGNFSEQIARFIGTARFLVYMTIVVVVWVGWNIVAPKDLRFDEYPFIFLTLALSLQASYAAPLILLAQNRQEARDRVTAEDDRAVNTRTQADAEFLAREMATVRIALSDVVTSDDLALAVARVTAALERLEGKLESGPS
jgi:uncharacterized membrane protein